MAGLDANGHQLITHYDPARLEWCGAECTCGQWSYESAAKADPATHIMTASVQAEKEWRRHIPVRERL